MEDIPNIAQYGIGGALAIAAAIALLFVRARQNRVETDKAKRAALENELKDAEVKHAAALWGGYNIDAIREKRRIDRLRRKLGRTKEDPR